MSGPSADARAARLVQTDDGNGPEAHKGAAVLVAGDEDDVAITMVRAAIAAEIRSAEAAADAAGYARGVAEAAARADTWWAIDSCAGAIGDEIRALTLAQVKP